MFEGGLHARAHRARLSRHARQARRARGVSRLNDRQKFLSTDCRGIHRAADTLARGRRRRCLAGVRCACSRRPEMQADFAALLTPQDVGRNAAFLTPSRAQAAIRAHARPAAPGAVGLLPRTCSPRNGNSRAAPKAGRPRAAVRSQRVCISISRTPTVSWSWPCAGIARVGSRCRKATTSAPLAVARALLLRGRSGAAARVAGRRSAAALPAAVDARRRPISRPSAPGSRAASAA